VDADQVSLAIGKNGQNVRLASKLSGFDIQLVKEGGEEEEEYDMDLSEFREELGDVLFHKFFDENFKSAKDVLDTPKEELVQTLGIEPEKIDEIVALLKKGLEEAEIEEEGGAEAAPPQTDAGEEAAPPQTDAGEEAAPPQASAVEEAIPAEQATEQEKASDAALGGATEETQPAQPESEEPKDERPA